ncbi:hypothetical protein OUZ56_017156 [Daphnia magna]|uniref:Uncharacterized protein n=1 Tax=Daphnia magna TaxID=35525 RepID=A0ABR0AS92_9CRUS|nr:hypothetical protein OUZ56_017156 [Daphnia magna]
MGKHHIHLSFDCCESRLASKGTPGSSVNSENRSDLVVPGVPRCKRPDNQGKHPTKLRIFIASFKLRGSSKQITTSTITREPDS